MAIKVQTKGCFTIGLFGRPLAICMFNGLAQTYVLYQGCVITLINMVALAEVIYWQCAGYRLRQLPLGAFRYEG